MSYILEEKILPLEIKVRPMKSADIEQVNMIDQISFSLPWPKRAYEYELHENLNSRLWVAEVTYPNKRERIVGFIVLWLIMDVAHIATLAVHPDLRGHGIAKCLLATAIRTGIKQGAVEATLEVRESNKIAQDLYRQFSFQVVGKRPHYYQDNKEDAVIMTAHNLDDEYLSWLEQAEINHNDNCAQTEFL